MSVNNLICQYRNPPLNARAHKNLSDMFAKRAAKTKVKGYAFEL